MRKPRTLSYVIDNLTSATAEKLRIALESVDSIIGIKISPTTGVLEVKSTRNVHDEIVLACNFAGVTMRTKVKKKGIFG